MISYYMGLDLGQAHDYTAAAVVERAELTGEWSAAMWTYRKIVTLRLRYLERIPLGTPYPDVVARVRQITRSKDLEGRCSAAVDATGAGRPVVDLLREADLGCTILPVVLTGGHTEGMDQGYYTVPKRDAITGLQVLLQKGELRIAAGLPLGETLVKEMMDMRVKTTALGHEQFGALAGRAARRPGAGGVHWRAGARRRRIQGRQRTSGGPTGMKGRRRGCF